MVKLNPGDTVLFRQCLPHQGMAYDRNNLRLFNYCDIIRRIEDSTQALKLNIKQQISITKLKKAKVFIPLNKMFINKN